MTTQEKAKAFATWLTKGCEDCETSWDDEWSCGCDDECPECGHAISPERSTPFPCPTCS